MCEALPPTLDTKGSVDAYVYVYIYIYINLFKLVTYLGFVMYLSLQSWFKRKATIMCSG